MTPRARIARSSGRAGRRGMTRSTAAVAIGALLLAHLTLPTRASAESSAAVGPTPVTTTSPRQPAVVSQLHAGAARRELVPPVRVPLAGYSRRHGQLSTGVALTPSVRALVLRDGQTSVAIVSAELLVIDEALHEAVLRRLPKAEAPDVVLLAATHTHSGPGAYGRRFAEKISMGHYDPMVFDFLADQIAQAILKAGRRLQPVRVSRTIVAAEGLVNNRVAEDGPIDDRLRVLVFRAADGPVAVLANFAAHATTLGASNLQMSGDYPGVLARAVEQRHPATVCLFTAGMVGDQAPAKGGDGVDSTEWIGGQLAERVLRAIEVTSETLADGSSAAAASDAADGFDARGGLRAAQRRLRLPAARVRVGGGSMPRWLGRLLVDDDATLTAVAIGDTVLLGAPCDLTYELGRELADALRAGGREPIVVSFANDYVGYCVSESLYGRDEYEARMAFNGPNAGRMIIDALAELIP
jgi:hypothetical protein